MRDIIYEKLTLYSTLEDLKTVIGSDQHWFYREPGEKLAETSQNSNFENVKLKPVCTSKSAGFTS
jgi:hypothetical protein